MANIDTYLQQIKTGVYGKDVRDAIHDAIKAVNQSIPTSTNVAQEVISARTPGDQGLPSYDNLKQRLDSESESLIEYADEKARPGVRAEIQITNATIGYSSLKDRLDSNYNSLYSKIGQVDAAISAAEEAVEAAGIATSKASEATNAANTAATKATEASNAASTASSNAQIATNRASQASTSASNAAYSANEAVMAAQQAQQAAQSVGTPDTTLTQQGKAADSKKVGDEITALKGDLNDCVLVTPQTLTEAQKAQAKANLGIDDDEKTITTLTSSDMEIGGYDNGINNDNSGNIRLRTKNYVSVVSGTLKYTISSAKVIYAYVWFYTTNDFRTQAISRTEGWTNASSTVTITVPSNAKYIRFGFSLENGSTTAAISPSDIIFLTIEQGSGVAKYLRVDKQQSLTQVQKIRGQINLGISSDAVIITSSDIEQGVLSDDGLNGNAVTYRCRTKQYISASPGSLTISVDSAKNISFVAIFYTTNDFTTPKIGKTDGWMTSGTIIVPENTNYIRLAFKVNEGTSTDTITPSDITSVVFSKDAVEDCIRFDIAQNLTDTQKEQARANIGAGAETGFYGIDAYLNTGKMQFMAHRGARLYAPENSIPAFEKAGQMGFDWLNLAQLRQSKDGTWYVMHDVTIDATTDGTGAIANLTDAYLSTVHIDTGINIEDFTPEELVIPTLETAIRIARKYGMKIYFRIASLTQNSYQADKAGWDSFIAIIRKYRCENMLFGGNSLGDILPLHRDLGLDWCVNWDTYTVANAQAQIQSYIDNGIKNATLFVSNALISDSLVTLARNGGYKVMVFDQSTDSTVNITKERALQLSNMGVDIVSGVTRYDLGDDGN